MSATAEDKDAIIAALRAENAALRERQAARDVAFDERAAHQAATIDVLKAMSASPGDPQPVFDLIVQQVVTLLDTQSSMLFEYDGALLHFRADAGTADLLGRDVMDEFLRDYPMAPHRGTVSGRAILDAAVVHVRDLTADPDRSEAMRALPYRSQISVPLLRDGRPIGVLTSAGPRVDAFSDAQVELLQTFAEQAVIAITSAETYRALQTRTAELATRNTEYSERIDHQAATIDVLQAMSASPGDPQPVFDLIVRQAHELCDSPGAMLGEFDGELLHLRSILDVNADPAALEIYKRRFPMAPMEGPQTSLYLEGREVHIRDADTDPNLPAAARVTGIRSLAGVPFRRDGKVIGAVILSKSEPGGYSDSQIELLRTFAEQAVIAITSAETFRALRDRTAELAERNDAFAERIEHQTATIDVLKEMSSSPGETQPVFDRIVSQAVRLCDGMFGVLVEYDGTLAHLRAVEGSIPGSVEAYRGQFPMAPTTGTNICRAILERDVVQIRDVDADPSVVAATRAIRHRASVAVPLLRAGDVIGAIGLAAREPGGFSDTQIELLKTFAEQAVIAITSAETYRALQTRTAELAERNTAFAERIDHQAATIDVLRSISASPDDARPALETIARRAWALCGEQSAILYRVDGSMIHLVAYHRPNLTAEQHQEVQSFWPRPIAESIMAPAVTQRRILHVRDVDAWPLATDRARRFWKSAIWVPMLRGDAVIGIIGIDSQERGGFSDTQVELLKTFAEQAVIAITSAETYRALQTRTAELAERNTSFAEQIDHQAATIDVLKAMSASPGDARPALEMIARRAWALCGEQSAIVYSVDGPMMDLVLYHRPNLTTELAREIRSKFPSPFERNIMAPAITERRVLHIRDIDTYSWPGTNDAARRFFRSAIWVPMLRGDTVIGLIGIDSREKGGFSDTQVELLKTFAEQAVIAITSAETYSALQTRTADLQTSLEYQTATSDVLAVISRSTANVQPVLDTLVETAARLCGANDATIAIREGEVYRFVAACQAVAADQERWTSIRQRTIVPGRDTVSARVLLEGDVVRIADILADPEFALPETVERGNRTMLGVPLLRDGDPIGVIALAWRHVEPYSQRQIELIRTFADQAVIAMENARLLNEQREALEQQTATAEVLQVINASPGDLTPVFEAMLEKAMRLCGVAFGMLRRYDGERVHELASRRATPAFADFLASWSGTRIRGATAMARALKECVPVQEVDIREEEGYKNGAAGMRAIVELADGRTVLHVPLVKDRISIGFFTFFRQEVRAFSDKEIALLANFAAQAVIAMENARLLTEQKEALERQTATAELLQVINASAGDLTPVFEAILDKAHALCGATVGSLQTYDGETVRAAATHGFPDEYAVALRQGAPLSDAVRQITDDGTRSGQVPDLRLFQGPFSRLGRFLLEEADVRTLLLVPLRKDGAFLGYISAMRPEVRPFSEKEVALVENFAAQAVVAMENARLLTEQREALERQTATADIMRAINTNPGDPGPVFDLILEKAHTLCGTDVGSLGVFDGTHFRKVALRGYSQEVDTQLRQPYPPLTSHDPLLRGESIHISDVANYHFEPDVRPAMATLIASGLRAWLEVPLWNNGKLSGTISGWRYEPRPFSDHEIALVENFAAQAVIAMENARLLTEQREALEQQTATAEVLGVINASPGDLVPVFDAILEKAHDLCGAAFGGLLTYDGESTLLQAHRNLPPAWVEWLAAHNRIDPGSPMHRLVQGEPLFQVEDLQKVAETTNDHRARAGVELGGIRTLLLIPLRKDGVLLGIITAYRREVRLFSAKQIALLENFAAQAVIAMENARLLTETREALEQQTATAEVLRVINESPGDLGPVFDAILNKAHTLCGAAIGSLYTWDGESVRAVATHGFPEDYAAFARQNHPPNFMIRPLIEGARYHNVPDVKALETRDRHASSIMEQTDARTILMIPLRKDGAFAGFITAVRTEVRPFVEKEIALLENFAAQAVIAMDNARLLNEIRQRQSELNITFENMGDGVAMFDAEQKLVAWNRNFQDILGLPDDAVRVGLPFADYIRGLAERGEYGPDASADEQITRLTSLLDQANRFERIRPNGRVIDIRQNPIPGGGFVIIYADITERKRAEEALRAARDEAETALRELKLAQANLVQAEKMASLGQLTAGIAHEIKNPLNFVNNFAALSVELLDELKETAAPAFAALDGDARADVDDLTETLTGNLKKIEEHGKRADGIVRSMLEHSRGASGERRAVDLNELVDEALNLAYHGARAQNQSFNITLERDYAPGIAPVTLTPQDMTRVLLNLIGNGFYAARKRREAGTAGFEPTLKVATRDLGDAVEVRVRDNGVGIPPDIRDKLFQPFFTTKPTGEGTGLGLSITWDIVTKAHGGTIIVDSEPGDHTEFTVTLPRHAAAEGARP